jgi:GT2 family glycosyltransferase
MTTATESDAAHAASSTERVVDQPGARTIYVLAPVHNRRALTERFVRCLTEQADQAFHLVLVDDGSTDGTADAVRSMIPSATIIRGTGHWWWAGSLEQARTWLKRRPAAPGDLVLIANDDTTFGPEFLASARAVMAASPRTLLLAAPETVDSALPAGAGIRIDWAKLAFQPAQGPNDADCFPTRGLFLGLADFLDLGSFHTILLPHYLSDYEFTLRAARRGYRLTTDPSVRLVKNELATGIRARDLTSVGAYLRSVLTIKATKNPVYWTMFVLLASPRRYLVGNLVRVWRRFGAGLLQAARLRPVPGE